jgi:hypothetical protein
MRNAKCVICDVAGCGRLRLEEVAEIAGSIHTNSLVLFRFSYFMFHISKIHQT